MQERRTPLKETGGSKIPGNQGWTVPPDRRQAKKDGTDVRAIRAGRPV